MRIHIPYLKWRDTLDECHDNCFRIGEDVLLMEVHHPVERTEGPYRTDMTTAIIYEKGHADIAVDMRPYHVEAPCIVFILQNSIYQTIDHSADISAKIVVMSKSFTDDLFSNLVTVRGIENAIRSSAVSKISENEMNMFSDYYTMLKRLASSPLVRYKLEAAKHLTLAMFYGYSHIKHSKTTSDGPKSKKLIYGRLLDMLTKYHKQERNINFYAEKLCISSKYLSECIKEQSGKTALEVIDTYVVTQAKSMLLSSEMSIQQISDELHFPSQSAFGKYFKRVTGLSPKAYRQKSL